MEPMEMYAGQVVLADDEIEPGTVLRDGGVILAHPTVIYGLRIVQAEPERRAFDPWVMGVASLMWQEDRIEQAAYQAERRLDHLMARQDLRRAQRAEYQRMAVALENTRLFVHKGKRHRWERDPLRATATCPGCGITITEEFAAYLRLELER